MYSNRKEEILTAILKSMRCVYGVPHDAEISREEWYGEDEYGGVKDFIWSMIRDEVKDAYKHGYQKGGLAVFDSVLSSGRNVKLEYSKEDAEIGAERAFGKWEME